MPYEEKIIELETKIAFLENNLQELSDVVAKQQQDILLLTKNNKLLVDKLKGLDAGSEINPENEKPPHY